MTPASSPSTRDSLPPNKRGDQLARIVSIVLHPVVTLLVLVIAATVRTGSANPWPVVLVTVGLAFVPITVIMIVQARSGRWQNVDASVPRERRLLFAVLFFFLLLLLAVMVIWSPASFLVRGVLAVGALFTIAWALLPWMKLSLHVACAAFAAAALSFIDWRLSLVLIAALPLLAWARVRMKRHALREVIAGAVLGAIIGLLVMLLPRSSATVVLPQRHLVHQLTRMRGGGQQDRAGVVAVLRAHCHHQIEPAVAIQIAGPEDLEVRLIALALM